MNKTDIVSAIAAKSGLTKKDAEKFLVAFEETVTESLAERKKVQLVGFLTMDVVDRPEREGRNPKTGDPMTIPASKSARFKAGKKLKDAVNN